MRALVLGIDGYIAWPLALECVAQGWEVWGVDDESRRRAQGNYSCVPISTPAARARYIQGGWGTFRIGYGRSLRDFLEVCKPDVIFHLAQMPAAPRSMESHDLSLETYAGNVLGNLDLLWSMRDLCPDAHLIKLGTMGEYGTPGVPIPEAGPEAFPRQPGSIYHSSKVADSVNCEFAARSWGLRITDIMQGVVYGVRTQNSSPHQPTATRFDIDATFGTVINRFCAQALLAEPLTVYGTGGQTRGFLPLRESMRCLMLAAMNPAGAGEYRVFNQLAEWRSMLQLAEAVSALTGADIMHIQNPRVELEDHFYEVACDNLHALGYEPDLRFEDDVSQMLDDLRPYVNRMRPLLHTLMPRIRWR